jgi:hypothetical protein
VTSVGQGRSPSWVWHGYRLAKKHMVQLNCHVDTCIFEFDPTFCDAIGCLGGAWPWGGCCRWQRMHGLVTGNHEAQR